MTRKVFMVGLGPSVGNQNLDLLIGHESWSMNRCHLIYEKTKWRPQRYYFTDMPQSSDHMDDIEFHIFLGENVWLREDIATWKFPSSGRSDLSKDKHVTIWKRCVNFSHGNAMANHSWKPKDWSCVSPTWKTNEPVYCKYGSGMSVMVQIAIRERFDEIYLLGQDLGFHGMKAGETENFHMVPGYWPTKTVDYLQERADIVNKTLWEMHDMIAKEADTRGVKIFNCSPISPLTQYPKVNLEDVCLPSRTETSVSGLSAPAPASTKRRSTASKKRASASTASI